MNPQTSPSAPTARYVPDNMDHACGRSNQPFLIRPRRRPDPSAGFGKGDILVPQRTGPSSTISIPMAGMCATPYGLNGAEVLPFDYDSGGC